MNGTDGYLHMPILRPLASRRFVQFSGSGGAKFPKMGDSLPRTPMTRRAKFDAASFILAEELRNRTNKNKQTNKITNSKRYIQSTPCLSACVYDNV